ncbi:MAG: copper chaperone [Alphaproteobacteria bacterium]|nr:copper chaperone [Alphaproteobacteria bacterium]
MTELTIEAMHCGACARRVTAAIRQVAPVAKVDIDVESHRVRVEGDADIAAVRRALSDAGYPPA